MIRGTSADAGNRSAQPAEQDREPVPQRRADHDGHQRLSGAERCERAEHRTALVVLHPRATGNNVVRKNSSPTEFWRKSEAKNVVLKRFARRDLAIRDQRGGVIRKNPIRKNLAKFDAW